MKNIATITVVAVASLALVGCVPGKTVIATPGPARGPARGLDPIGSGEKSAVERVNDLSEKYAALADKCMKLQKDNVDLQGTNRELIAAAAKDKSELGQVKKELADANVVIDQLSQDIKDWQNNVLGFRDEIRKAQALQVEKLVELMRFLGAETKTPKAPGKTAVKTGDAKKKDGTSDVAAG